MAGKAEVFSFDASPARVWAAMVQSLASLGYNVQHSDRESGALSFNTGRSMSSWAGQDLSASIVASGTGTRMTMGGSLARGGNPFGGGSQVGAWGEKSKLIRRFAETVKKTLPAVSEPASHAAPASSSLADELAKIAQLRDSGVLSEEEFIAGKQRLLSGS